MLKMQIEIWKLQLSGFFMKLRCRWMEWRFRKINTERTLGQLVKEIEDNPSIYTNNQFDQHTELLPMPEFVDMMFENDKNSEDENDD